MIFIPIFSIHKSAQSYHNDEYESVFVDVQPKKLQFTQKTDQNANKKTLFFIAQRRNLFFINFSAFTNISAYLTLSSVIPLLCKSNLNRCDIYSKLLYTQHVELNWSTKTESDIVHGSFFRTETIVYVL